MRRVLITFAVLVAIGAVLVFIGPPKIPPEVIASSVIHDQALLERAWALPVARTYRRELYWQKNGSLCGPATLRNVFASQGEQFANEGAILAGSGKCWTGFCLPGLTLDELAVIARLRTHESVTVLRDLTPAQFENELEHTNDVSRRYTINFTRQPIFGGGGGHHSPIGGYLEPEHLVLVLDVNEHFKPWLIERDRLYAAMNTVDSSTHQTRGMLRIQ